MLDGDAIFGLQLYRRLLECLGRLTTPIRQLFVRLRHRSALALPFEVGLMCLLLVVDTHQRRRIARDLELLRDNERDRLSAELNLISV